MSFLKPLDERFPIGRQLGVEAASVVPVNVFTRDGEGEQAFLDTWRDHAAFMKRQPGFMSTQLNRAIGALLHSSMRPFIRRRGLSSWSAP